MFEVVKAAEVPLVNQTPVAAKDTFNVRAGETLNVVCVTHKSVLADDKDPEDDTVKVTTLSLIATLKGGTVTMNGIGTFNYVPAI